MLSFHCGEREGGQDGGDERRGIDVEGRRRMYADGGENGREYRG